MITVLHVPLDLFHLPWSLASLNQGKQLTKVLKIKVTVFLSEIKDD